MSQAELNMMETHHSDTVVRWSSSLSTMDIMQVATYSTQKVEIALELNGQWPALIIQEYKPVGTAKKDIADVLRPVADSELVMHFRHSAEDARVLLPCLGRNGDARPIGNFLDPNLITNWIQQCKVNHGLCSQTRTAHFPVDLILIDTESMCIVDMTTGTKPSYLALSYTWGSVTQPVLTKDTRAQWSIEGKLSEIDIPRTVLDAIDLAKMIGYRFLWVDALCIVQDDSSIRHHQITQMYDIYQSADLTIVAAGSDDCSGAIPGVGLSRKTVPDEILHNIAGLPLMKLPASLKYSIEASRWKSRGWTFQEELCSQRLLVLLPYCAVFTCASALCREDLCFEVISSSLDPQEPQRYQNFREGLTLLSVTLRHLQTASPQQQLVWFQDLIKQYMHRSLSRDEDIENAFAGVSRMLEPLFGSFYHGVPEKYFADFIHGCWFWDTSSVRRTGGFPSWSWVGWIYRQEQTELGVKAVAGQSIVLQFYRFKADIQILGQSESSSRSEALSGAYSSISNHFIPNEEKIRAQFMVLQANGCPRDHLIAFTTSCASLHIRQLYSQSFRDPEMTSEYHVVHPHTGKPLTSIRLRGDFTKRAGRTHQFIVVACDKNGGGFQLMLVAPPRPDTQVVERVNVTVQNRLVQVDDWMSTGPQMSTIVMA